MASRSSVQSSSTRVKIDRQEIQYGMVIRPCFEGWIDNCHWKCSTGFAFKKSLLGLSDCSGEATRCVAGGNLAFFKIREIIADGQSEGE